VFSIDEIPEADCLPWWRRELNNANYNTFVTRLSVASNKFSTLLPVHLMAANQV
jgi:hypothetical protein